MFFRLNITAEGTPGKTPHRATPIGSRKRKRMAVSHQGAGDISHLQSSASSAFNATSSAAGPVEICEVDPAGQYIKIHNTSDKVCPPTCYSPVIPWLHSHIMVSLTYGFTRIPCLHSHMVSLAYHGYTHIPWLHSHTMASLSYGFTHISWLYSHTMASLTYGFTHISWLYSHTMASLTYHGFTHIPWFHSHSMVSLTYHGFTHISWFHSHHGFTHIPRLHYSRQPYCDVCGQLHSIARSGISMFTFNTTPVWPMCGITCCILIARGITQLSVDVTVAIVFYRKLKSDFVFPADQQLCQRLLAAAPLPMVLTTSYIMFCWKI